MYMITSK